MSNDQNIVHVTFIGFGEAAQSFTQCWTTNAAPWMVLAYDIKQDIPEARPAQIDNYRRYGITWSPSLAGATKGASVIISAVTAGQALSVAEEVAKTLREPALYLDINSTTPADKKAAMVAIEGAGGKYADIAVMAPVDPLGLKVPMLVAGPHADLAVRVLTQLGFKPRAVAGGVGAAAAIKMIRSIMIKGIEALTAECMLSAYSAGVEDEVIASLDGSWPGYDWKKRADYNLDRMMIHGRRRAEEMRAARDIAIGLGAGGEMSAATAAWQEKIAVLGLNPPPEGLARKAAKILEVMNLKGADE